MYSTEMYSKRIVALMALLLGLLLLVSRTGAEPEAPVFDCNTAVDIPAYECQALVALYENTNGANWEYNNGWLVDPTVCNWAGVDCDPYGVPAYVTSLQLSGNGLAGSIPPDLGSLSQLHALDLFANQLTGGIPPELGNLRYLERLYLGHNQLTGPLPPELGNLTYLYVLYLKGNQLTGGIPDELGKLQFLEYLYLDDNHLTGGIPSELGQLSFLKYLHLQANALTGGIPPSLGNITNLTELHLEDNALSGGIPSELANLVFLETLYLSANQLTGGIPPELALLPNLRILDLSHNQLTGSIPTALSNLTRLQTLYLSGNQLTGPIPSDLGQLPLYDLFLGDNHLTGNIPPELGNLAALEYLYLDGNQLTGPIPPTLGNLNRLDKLYLDGNQLTGAIPPELGNLTGLDELDLSRNQLTGPVPPDLGNIQMLDLLALSHNALFGPVPPALLNAGSSTGTGTISHLSLDYNSLYSVDAAVTNFLESHNPTFFATQTVAPDNFVAGVTGTTWVDLGWTPIPYTDDGGYYEISYAIAPTGTYTVAGTTTAKTAAGLTVTGLAPAGEYLFRVRTFTPAHDLQQNDLWSEYTGPITTTTGLPATFSCASATGIPVAECQALVALYNSTNGPHWTDSSGWLDTFTPCDWYGVTCGAGHVTLLDLAANGLDGTIPAELDQLSQLVELFLDRNDLRGPIPATLASLDNLLFLNVEHNRLEGAIPPELGALSPLARLQLGFNRLGGAIPPQLGNLANLSVLTLNHNALHGAVPANLVNLGDALPVGVDLQLSLVYNALYSADPALSAFLEMHDPDFFLTQTVAPQRVEVDDSGPGWVTLHWEPILYRDENPGFYEISYATAEAGPYRVAATTADKWADGHTVVGLAPGTHYFFRLRTFTAAHDDQQNDLWSAYTQPLPLTLPEHAGNPLYLPILTREE